jgi:FkbM family methyltransferase
MKEPFRINLLLSIPKIKYYYIRYLERWVDKHITEELHAKIYNGSMMFCTLKDWVQRNLFMYGYYEKHESTFWQYLTRNKINVFDIGANVGYFSLLASNNVKSGIGKVYAFEPITKTYERALHNIRLNNYTNIQLLQIAISDKNGLLTINVGNEENWGMSSVNRHNYLSGTEETISCQTLDTFVEQHNIHSVDVIKMDIEGSELRALRGMVDAINRFRPSVLIEVLDEHLNKSGGTKEEVFEYFFSKQYNAFRIVGHLTLVPLLAAVSYDGLVFFCPSETTFDTNIKILN